MYFVGVLDNSSELSTTVFEKGFKAFGVYSFEKLT